MANLCMQPLFARLRRITSGGQWIPEIDGLRFIAIFAVVLYHLDQQLLLKADQFLTIRNWYAPLLRLISNGSRGVELFFVISGFMLGLPFARHSLLREKQVSIAHYFLRRLTRLEPPYLCNLVVLAAAIMIHEYKTSSELVAHFLATALYIHELIYQRVSTINGVTWTLEIEIQFYLIVPILALVYRLRPASLRRGSFVVAAAAFVAWELIAVRKDFWGNPEAWIYNSVFFYLQFFLTGMLLSDLYLTLIPRWKPGLAWDAAGLCCWMIYFYENVSWDAALLPILLFIGFIGAFRGICLRRFFRMEAPTLIGGMCYTIYLWHFFLIAIFFKVTKHLLFGDDTLANLAFQCLILMPLILFFSAHLFLFFERPFMDPQWPQRLVAKAKAAAR